MHFMHIKPSVTHGKRVVPLLLLHGWPGSVREFYSMIALLSQPNEKLDIAFEIIVPSLPGFGWSDGATRRGLSPMKMAIVLRNLMLRFGHQKFFIQCGDWGSLLGSHISTLFPENVHGYHTNLAYFVTPKALMKLYIASFCPSLFVSEQHRKFHFAAKIRFKFILQESGYFLLQATKPDTIGAALASHPVGLAAYILEKFNLFVEPIGMDAVLDNLMVYYMNDNFTTATRLYAEAITPTEYDMMRIPTQVPTGVARFRRDMLFMLDWQLRDKYPNLIQSTYHHEGGHFAAFERPNALYEDFVEFVRKTQLISK